MNKNQKIMLVILAVMFVAVLFSSMNYGLVKESNYVGGKTTIIGIEIIIIPLFVWVLLTTTILYALRGKNDSFDKQGRMLR